MSIYYALAPVLISLPFLLVGLALGRKGVTGYLKRYSEMVMNASAGAVLKN